MTVTDIAVCRASWDNCDGEVPHRCDRPLDHRGDHECGCQAQAPQCGAEYAPERRARGARIVRCDLVAGHEGDHEELATESTWPTTTDPTAPATPGETLDLDAIEERATIAAPSRLRTAMGCIPNGQIRQGCILSDGDTIRAAIRAAAKLVFKDVPALVAEVRRLRAELDGTETQ